MHFELNNFLILNKAIFISYISEILLLIIILCIKV